MSKQDTKFKKGKSGNPGGRPTNELGRMLREKKGLSKEIEKRVLECLRQKKSDKIALWAAEFLRDTMWGKPVQAVSPVDGDGNPLVLQIINHSDIKPKK